MLSVSFSSNFASCQYSHILKAIDTLSLSFSLPLPWLNLNIAIVLHIARLHNSSHTRTTINVVGWFFWPNIGHCAMCDNRVKDPFATGTCLAHADETNRLPDCTEQADQADQADDKILVLSETNRAQCWPPNQIKMTCDGYLFMCHTQTYTHSIA